eukprot:scaffold2352_cov153-Ochromonas_danica.AAC.24
MSGFLDTHSNPLLRKWADKNYGLPPFHEIQPGLFEEALQVAMEAHINEIKRIVTNHEPADFQNTVLALDQAGELFNQVHETFSNLCSSVGVPELQAVELKLAAPLATHFNQIVAYPGLFERLDSVYQKRHDSGLDELAVRLTERFHLDAVRAGARFSAEARSKYAAIIEELAELTTKFTQNVMADEADVYLELTDGSDVAGLPEDLVKAARQAGEARGLSSPIITLSRSLVEPFLTFSERRDLREKAWKLWTRRGELDEQRANLPIARRILELRLEQAKLHGFENFAQYALADTMARNPETVQKLLEEVWTRGKESVERERGELLQYLAISPFSSGETNVINPWDWRFLAERVRQQSYTVDQSQIKAYFSLQNMVEALFSVANKLFGLTFQLREDLQAYHPDVLVYEVFKNNKLQAIFLHDNYARPHKRSGAWMSELRTQSYDQSGQRLPPIVMNNNNFNRPHSGKAADCLLSFDDVRTLFHEFGHGLHGMLSDVQYRRLASTNVLRDFVELPSQLYEHWAAEPAVLNVHARHVESGEVQTGLDKLDLSAWESEQLAELDMPTGIIMRHRLPHFQHLFSGESYASAYYVYLWAEVLDADAFEAFKEAGNCFDTAVAQRVLQFIYSAGNSKDPAELFRSFRGRDPVIDAMLRKKGLLKP